MDLNGLFNSKKELLHIAAVFQGDFMYLGIIWMRLSKTAGKARLRDDCEIPDLPASSLLKAPVAPLPTNSGMYPNFS